MIVFKNPGLIDLRCLRAFGVNVKPLTSNPIGSFGTGAKASLAILMRLKQAVTLWRGLERYTFGTRAVTIRDKAFDFVTMTHPDGTVEEMAYNTHVGEHWEDWTPYRELHSNVLDEKGETLHLPTGVYAPRANETAFVVEGDVMERAHVARHTIFLPTVPFLATPTIEAHRGNGKHLYYRGIRVMDLTHPSVFTYNLLNLPNGLTEDRTLKSEADLKVHLGSLISKAEDESYLEAVLTAPEGTYEYHLSDLWGEPASEAFSKVYSGLRHAGRVIDLTSFANGVYKRKHQHLPIPDAVPMTRIQQKQLDKAIAFCAQLGWPVSDFPIIVVPHERNGLLAWAQDNTIVLTQQVFDKGTKEVACTLYEEYLHAKHGFSDCTRAFQTHLFQTIMTMGETLIGEPL